MDFLSCTFARVDSLRTVLDKNEVTFADDVEVYGVPSDESTFVARR